MKNNIIKKIVLLLLCLMLIAAMAFTTAGCGKEQVREQEKQEEAETPEEQEERIVKGEGSKSFKFNVTDENGNTAEFLIKTDKETVGEALLELEIIAGTESSATGLYVKTVNGVLHDYDIDKTYWAFYIDGSYATTGVDLTKITEGALYEFKVESM